MPTLTPTKTPATRSGSVRILRDAIAVTLGDASRAFSAAYLASTGSLLVSITSETKRGPVTKSYRVSQDGDSITLRQCIAGIAAGWEGDAGEVYTLDSSFGGGVTRCDCQDAKYRCHDVTVGSRCKHRLAMASLSLLAE